MPNNKDLSIIRKFAKGPKVKEGKDLKMRFPIDILLCEIKYLIKANKEEIIPLRKRSLKILPQKKSKPEDIK